MKGKYYAIITAGGIGSRLGGDIAKQFLEIEGKPILRWCIERFIELPFKVEIIVVVNSEAKESWKEYCRENDFLFKYILTTGGITRFHSVKNALKYVERGGIVAVHDGVRPIITSSFLEKMFTEATNHFALIPVLPCTDSLRIKNEDGLTMRVNREDYMLVQTPQMFKTDVLLDAYSQSYSPDFTDDASVVESIGYRIETIAGERNNIKITTKEDLEIARMLMSNRGSDRSL